MWKQNLNLFFRTIKRSKSIFLINTLGLTGGLTAVLLIFLWVTNELNVDQFAEKDSARHVQVVVNHKIPNGIETDEATPGPLTMALGEEIPEVDYAVPVVPPRSFYNGVLLAGENNIKAKPQFVGDGFFNIFGCDFLLGNKATALEDKKAVVISETMALALFQGVNGAMGKTVMFKNKYFDGTYKVTGVFKLPNNASAQYDVLFNFDTFLAGRPNLKNWNNGGVRAHLVLLPGVSVAVLNTKIDGFLKSKIEGTSATLHAQKYAEKYLNGGYVNGIPSEGRMKYVTLFSIIGLLILVLACINFTNLSTANASRRIKEIGIKKAAGANRTALMIQFLSEAILMSLLALIISIPLVKLLLPMFNEVTGTNLDFTFDYRLVLSFVGIAMLTGIISGYYPAIYLSSLKPIHTLKGKIDMGTSGFWIRKGLVIFQFSISTWTNSSG